MSDDDKILRTLGAMAAEQQREDPASFGVAPLDELARERIVDHLVSRMAPARHPARSRVLAVAISVSGLAVAAGVVFVAFSLGASEPLPRYALYASGESSMRGAPTAGHDVSSPCVLKASRDGSFELLASTEDPVSGPVGARAFLVRNGEPQPWPGALEVSPKGSVRVVDATSGLTGASELRVVVGRPDQLGGDNARAKARGTAASGRGWQVLRCAIE